MFFMMMLSALSDNERNFAEEIFENYYKLIYKIAYDILNNPQDAEDTLDEVMINVMNNIEKFLHASGNEITSQIVIYSRNAAINLYNKNKRRTEAEQPITVTNEDGSDVILDLADIDFNLEDLIISNETVEIIKRHLKSLSQEHRDVINLVYSFGYSNVEAAKILHISPNAVGLRLFKAKKKLLEIAGGELSELI